MVPRTPFLRILAMFTLVVAATAAVTVPFVRDTLRRPLPYREPAGLFICFQRIAYQPMDPVPEGRGSFSLVEWQRENRALEELAGFHWQKFDVPSTGGTVETVQGSRVSREFFAVLGVRPALGRVFSEEAQPQPGAGERRVVLSDAFRRRYFGAAPDIVGRTLTLDGKDYSIRAVMPPGFWFLSRGVQFWVLLPSRPNYFVSTVARVRPEAGVRRAQAEVLEIEKRLSRRAPFMPLRSLQDYLYTDARTALYLTMLGLIVVGCIGASYVYALWRADGSATERFVTAARTWAFLLMKAGAGLLLLLTIWVLATGGAVRLRDEVAAFSGTRIAFEWVLLLLGCGVIRWAVFDQNARCPVCLCRLRMPVVTGSWSSLVMDRPGTEYICPYGHGRLYVPGTRLLNAAPMRWTFYRDFLQQLFADADAPQRHKARKGPPSGLFL
jgi:hypothetical protein